MKWGDRILQRWRILKASRWIRPGTRVLDIGCANGALFARLASRIATGIGIDPNAESIRSEGHCRIVPGYFPADLPDHRPFDVITLLAVLEHIPADIQSAFAGDCARYLNPGGRLIVTVPSALVDPILRILTSLRLVDGMSLDEHWGFEPRTTSAIFERAGLRLVTHRRFQLGLNHLFVFERASING